MDRAKVIEALKKAKENSKKRKFAQTYDLILNLQNIDMKKSEQLVDFYTMLQFGKGKKSKVCAFVGPELKPEAKGVCDTVIDVDEFASYSDKKKMKKLADEHEYFIAQANIMAKVATVFGKVLGVRGKMPNPKAGCVVPPKAALKPLHEKLQQTIRVRTKAAPVIQTIFGDEGMDEGKLADNLITLYNQIINHLPAHENNIKEVYIKLTMGKPVRVV